MFDDEPENWSAVARIYEQVRSLDDQGINNIRGGYVEGTFTQDNPILRYIDGVSGYTFERRVETAYDQFCKQAKDWLREDPDAQIRSEEHTSELQSLMRISYAVFCLKTQKPTHI